MDQLGISVRELTRLYAGKAALRNVSLDVPRGATVGLLGPNGAGKTTLVRVITTLLVPTSGHVSVAGNDVVADARLVRRACGVSFGGESGLYGRLSARDNLRYGAALYAVPRREVRGRVRKLLDDVGLLDRIDDRVETFSRGMKQRLHIARALIHDPSVVLLDEPSSGLDPRAAQDLRELVRSLARPDRTILLTTHDLREAEELCSRVAILVAGEIVAEATPSELRRVAAENSGHCIEIDNPDALADVVLGNTPGLLEWKRDGDLLRVYTRDVPAAIAWLLEHSARMPQLQVLRPSLEEAYLRTFV